MNEAHLRQLPEQAMGGATAFMRRETRAPTPIKRGDRLQPLISKNLWALTQEKEGLQRNGSRALAEAGMMCSLCTRLKRGRSSCHAAGDVAIADRICLDRAPAGGRG